MGLSLELDYEYGEFTRTLGDGGIVCEELSELVSKLDRLRLRNRRPASLNFSSSNLRSNNHNNQGVLQHQRTLHGTPLRKQAIQNPGKSTFTKQPAYLTPTQNIRGTQVIRDTRRICEAAVIVSTEWFHQNNMCPPSDDDHAALKKTTVSGIMSRHLRAGQTPQLSLRGSAGQRTYYPALRTTTWMNTQLI